MEEVSKQIYVETSYDGVNVGAIVTPSGVICIDVPSYARDARDWAARMHRLSPYPVQHIIITDSCGDRILNTRWLNAPIIMQQVSADMIRGFEKKYPQSLLDSLAIRQPHRSRELSNGPVENATTSFSDEIVMYRHGQPFVLKHAGGPMKGNAWVILPERRLVFAGDTLMANTHPHLAGGDCLQWIESLRELLSFQATHHIVPGRGYESSTSAIIDSIDYLTEMHEKVGAHAEAGKPREALVTMIPHFFAKFPLYNQPKDWVQQQIRLSLGYLYDEVKSSEPEEGSSLM